MKGSTRLPYIPGLDGVRAVAVMAVLGYHANLGWLLGGFLGVETFFVLSGFLITALLLAEWNASGQIDLRSFWLRRARRLLPAVWVLLLVLPVAGILFAKDALPRLAEDIPAALLYATNWVYIFREIPYFEAFARPPLLQQLWSLAVEEQFYLLWPLFLAFLLPRLRHSRGMLFGAILLLIAVSTAWMALLFSPSQDTLRVYYGTDTRAAGFLVGSALAILRSPESGSSSKDLRIREGLGWAGLLLLALLFNQLNEFQPFLYRGGFLLAAIASVLLIVGASTSGSVLSRILEYRLLRWVGTRSYSIYLWHWPVFMLTRPGIDVSTHPALVRLGQLAITFALAELSYRWVEAPIRRHGFQSGLKALGSGFRRLSRPRRLGLGAGLLSLCIIVTGFAFTQRHVIGTAETTAHLETRVTIGGAATTHVEPQTVSPAEGPRQASTPTLLAPAMAPPTTTPLSMADRPRVTLIGDSIMQGTIPMLEDTLGSDAYIDAARKRRMEDVPQVLAGLSEAGKLAPIVVIHLGSNRPFDASILDEVVESLLAHEVKRMIFINVHRPIGWESYANRQFEEGMARWPQMELVDWESLAHSRQEWFIQDQTHLSYEGSRAYVRAIVEQLESGP